MPRSIQFTQEVGGATTSAFVRAVNGAPNLAELLDLVPAPYRPRLHDLVGRVYRAALKSNHTRTYLATLEKHELEGTFPPEIGARIAAPALQISKEYSSDADYKKKTGEMDTLTVAHKKDMLEKAIALKKAELSHLQSLFAEDTWKPEALEVVLEVTAVLVADAGAKLKLDDGSVAASTWPQWIADDYNKMKAVYCQVPARAVALAYAHVAQEMSKKMKGLSLKRRTDEDIEMLDNDSRAETVAAQVERKFNQLLKENKLQKVVGNTGKGKKKTPTPKGPSQSTIQGFKIQKPKGGKGNKGPQGGGKRGKGQNKK